MSQALASLLLGVGYDAYVVSGYAPAAITRCDQTSTQVPQPPPPPVVPPVEVVISEKYKIRGKTVLQSTFLSNKTDREKAAKEKQQAAAAPPVDEEAMAAAEAEELDDLKGKRVHSWVVVLPGKRMLEQLLFIESSTGRCYTADQ